MWDEDRKTSVRKFLLLNSNVIQWNYRTKIGYVTIPICKTVIITLIYTGILCYIKYFSQLCDFKKFGEIFIQIA